MRSRELLDRVKRLEPAPPTPPLPFNVSLLTMDERRSLLGAIRKLNLAGCLRLSESGGIEIPPELQSVADRCARLLDKCRVSKPPRH
jgi:hypothetical protein